MKLKLLKDALNQNTILEYIIAAGVFMSAVVVLYVIKKVVFVWLKKQAQKTTVTFDDFLVKTIEKLLFPILFYLALSVSASLITLPKMFVKGIDMAGFVITAVIIISFVISLLNYFLQVYLRRSEASPEKTRSLKVMVGIIKFAVGSLALLVLFDNLGVKISALIAGLGIGGVALAFASQAILADLFSFFVIIFDKPFEKGDFIVVGDFMGTVEHMGIKTTRLRSLSGEQLILSNNHITNSQIRNFKRMEKRRVAFKLGVTYDTKLDQLKEVPVMIADIIKSTPKTVFDRAHFSGYGDFSLIIDVVYFVLSSDFGNYMDVHQSINFRIKEAFEKAGINFAYPTQTLIIQK